jgi:integrase
MQSLFEVSDEYVRRKLRFCAELTRRKYRRVCNRFGEFLGRTPVVSDLQTETVLDFLAWIHHERRQSAHTTNEARAKLVALWNYAAKQHLTTVFPDVSKLPAPERLPVAWTVSDFQALLRAAAQLKGQVAGMPAAEIFEVKLFEKEGRCKKERVPVPVELFFSELKAKIIAMRKSESKDITKEVEYVRQKKNTYV